MAAMVMGPVSGWLIKKFDQAVDGRIPAGFEMLINNFSIGIFGMLLAIIGYFGIGPLMEMITKGLTIGVDFLVDHTLLPLAAMSVELVSDDGGRAVVGAYQETVFVKDIGFIIKLK
jgi:PTS system mannitol-specific IIC component